MSDQRGTVTEKVISLEEFVEPYKLFEKRDGLLNESTKDIELYLKRGFEVLKNAYYESILFVGLNPSYVDIDGKQLDEKIETHEKSYVFRTPCSYRNYFCIFCEVCNGTCPGPLTADIEPLNYTHLDLFQVRLTRQDELVKLLKNRKLIDFFVTQFKMTCEMIMRIKPTAIVIVNALASKIFSAVFADPSPELNNKLKLNITGDLIEDMKRACGDALRHNWSDSLGTYIITDGDLRGIPVFYSGMLSGQRALDVGSRKRLKWHINYVLKNK